jgi:hypothetical protein
MIIAESNLEMNIPEGITEEMILGEIEKRKKFTEKLSLNVDLTYKDICYTSSIPTGWILAGGKWDPTSCGRPQRIFENIWTILRYDNLPVGTVIEVCLSAPTPNGWIEVGRHWDFTKCGRPQTIVDNVKTIKRTR